MNERIKELEKQCWSHRIDGYLIDGQLHFDSQKFAELIVRECANIAASAEPHQIKKMILKHFRVEE